MGGLCAWRAAENAQSGAQAYLRWQEANEPIMDRYGMKGIPQEALAEVGWSPTTAALVGSQWFFLDEAVSADAFVTLTPYAQALRDESVPGLCREAAEVLAQTWRGNAAMQPAFWLWLCSAALCAAALLWRMRREKRMAQAPAPGGDTSVSADMAAPPVQATMPTGDTGAGADMAAPPVQAPAAEGGSVSPGPCLWVLGLSVAGALCMLFLLAYFKGRMPLRAALLVLLPAAGLALGLLAMALGALGTGRAGAAARALSLVLAATLSVWALCCQLPGFLPDPAHVLEMGDPAADLIAFAQSEPDMLILYDITLVGDSRLFPDVSEGVPHNLSYWGGWWLRSPQSVAQFANWDVDLWHFDPETLLREDVLLATCVVDPPPNQLMSWLEEQTGESVDCILYGESGFVYFFQFYVP